MIPLGLADLSQAETNPNARAPFDVGARLLARQGGHVTLGDAWRTLTLVDAAGAEQPASPASPGDVVRARLELSPDGSLHCTALERLTPGQPQAAPRSAHALAQRQRAFQAIRAYFERHRFLEVSTPTFGVCPGLDPHVHSLSTVTTERGVEHLMTSPELFMKRLLVSGVPRCFQLAQVFRAGERGAWHEPEFTLLEWYRAYEGQDAILADTEALVREVARSVADDPTEAERNRELSLDAPFLRLTVREAFSIHADVADACELAQSHPETFEQLLVDRVEPALRSLPGPVFLTHFPAARAALARLSPDDPSTALRFELYVNGVEIANGYDELTDPIEQRQRFVLELERRRQAGEPSYPLDERFLDALSAGMPPAAGIALGVDRLLAVLLGHSGIGAFYAFPSSEH